MDRKKELHQHVRKTFNEYSNVVGELKSIHSYADRYGIEDEEELRQGIGLAIEGRTKINASVGLDSFGNIIKKEE